MGAPKWMVENNGKPYVLMDDFGGFSTPLFLENIQISINVAFEVTFPDFATDNSAVDGWTPGGRESGWFFKFPCCEEMP